MADIRHGSAFVHTAAAPFVILTRFPIIPIIGHCTSVYRQILFFVIIASYVPFDNAGTGVILPVLNRKDDCKDPILLVYFMISEDVKTVKVRNI